MGLFGKKTQPLALPSPGPAFNGAAETTHRNNPLREKFKKARFGHTCRTLTLCNPEGDNLGVYRQMICLSPGDKGWRVLEISDYPTLTGEIALKNKTVENQLNFLDAIENIALWQAGQIKLGYAANEEEAEKLGLQYFVKFGERENLAFDIHGQPHTTLEGEVVTDGYFTQKARENAKASIAEPPPPPPPLPRIDPLAGLKFRSESNDEDLVSIMKKMHNQAKAHDLLDQFKRINEMLKQFFERGLADGSIPELLNKSSAQFESMSGRLMQPKADAAAYLARNIGYSRTMETYLDQATGKCLNSISELDIPQDNMHALRQMAYSYKTIFYALASKFLIKVAAETTHDRAKVMNDANSYAQMANSAYNRFSNSNEQLWKIRVFILQDESPLKVPDIFDEFTAAFEASLSKAGQALAEERKLALSPPVALALPKPQNS